MNKTMDAKINATNSTLDELNEERRHLLMPLTIFLAVILATGIVGNSFVVCVYGRRYSKNAAIFFILTLGCTHLVSCCLMAYDIYELVNPLINQIQSLCNNMRFLQTFSYTYSILIIVCLAIDRILISLKPSAMMTVKQAKALIIVMFCLSLAVTWPRLFLRVMTSNRDDMRKGCDVTYFRTGSLYSIYYESVLCFTCTICVFTCLVVYLLIALKICCRRHFLSRDDPRNSLRRKKFERVLITRALESMKIGLLNGEKPESKVKIHHGRFSMIACVVTFLIFTSYLPFLSVTYLRYTSQWSVSLPPTDLLVYEICSSLYFLNNMICPVIYCFLDRSFVHELLNCFRKK